MISQVGVSNAIRLIDQRKSIVSAPPAQIQAGCSQSDKLKETEDLCKKQELPCDEVQVFFLGHSFVIPYNLHTDPRRFSDPLRRGYLQLSQISCIIAQSSLFSNIMIAWIALAGLLVGVETYPTVSDSPAIPKLDKSITIAFLIEIGVRFLAEGFAPWRFFIGKEWRWNNFDLVTTIICALPFNGNEARLARLFRLMRAARIIRRIPQFRIIVMGLIGGISNVVYIFMVLLMVYFLYAIVGMLMFMKNDPFYMGALHRAVLTLFKCSTMEDWHDVLYINMWGCNEWPHLIYVPPHSEEKEEVFWCSHPRQDLIGGVIFMVSFQVFAGLVVMSLFIGVVAVSMEESLQQMKIEAEQRAKEKKMEEGRQKAEELARFVDHKSSQCHADSPNSDTENLEVHVKRKLLPTKEQRENRRIQKLLTLCWTGKELELEEDNFNREHPLIDGYMSLAVLCQKIDSSIVFRNCVIVVIVVAALEAGFQTETDKFTDAQVSAIEILDKIISAIFTVEASVKLIAEEFEPWRYFYDGWNLFDVAVLVGSWMKGKAKFFFVLRLMRVLRVLKLVKNIPALQVIVQAILKSLNSVAVIGVLMALFNYMCSVVGIILFQANDPMHYGTLHLSMIQLFKVSTREDWSEPLFVNAYGCDQFGYEIMPWLCTQPEAQYAASVVFHVFNFVIASLVLLTLFIGIVMTSMEESCQKMKFQQQVKERVGELQSMYKLTNAVLNMYRDVFNHLDIDGGGTIEKEEFIIGLRAIGKDFTEEEVLDIFEQVDEDRSGEIDFGEFIELMIVYKNNHQQKKPEIQNANRDSLVAGMRRISVIGTATVHKIRHSIEMLTHRTSETHRNSLRKKSTGRLVVPVDDDILLETSANLKSTRPPWKIQDPPYESPVKKDKKELFGSANEDHRKSTGSVNTRMVKLPHLSITRHLSQQKLIDHTMNLNDDSSVQGPEDCLELPETYATKRTNIVKKSVSYAASYDEDQGVIKAFPLARASSSRKVSWECVKKPSFKLQSDSMESLQSSDEELDANGVFSITSRKPSAFEKHNHTLKKTSVAQLSSELSCQETEDEDLGLRQVQLPHNIGKRLANNLVEHSKSCDSLV